MRPSSAMLIWISGSWTGARASPIRLKVKTSVPAWAMLSLRLLIFGAASAVRRRPVLEPELQSVPGEHRALHPDGELAHALERRGLGELLGQAVDGDVLQQHPPESVD